MKSKIFKIPLVIGGIFFSQSVFSESTLLSKNLDVFTKENQLNSTKEEKKINRSLFLPEFSVNTGLGSESLFDEDEDKGPYLFLEGRINLFRGGRDQDLLKQTQVKIDKLHIEKEVTNRKVRIEAFKTLSEIQRLKNENEYLQNEIKDNKIQQGMAQKKVNAGLTTNVDILDFEIKDQNLNNRIAINNLNIESLTKNVLNLYSNEITFAELENEFLIMPSTSLDGIDANNYLNITLTKFDIESAKLNKQIAKGEYLPSIDLEAKWGQITPQSKLWKEEKEHSVFLNLSFPFYTGGTTSAKINQSILEMEQKEREIRQQQLEANTNFQVEQKKIEILNNLLRSYKLILSKSEKYKNLTINEYKRGIKNSPDVISASDKNLEASIKTLETSTELSIAIFTLKENFKKY
jgi:outer membrane protein